MKRVKKSKKIIATWKASGDNAGEISCTFTKDVPRKAVAKLQAALIESKLKRLELLEELYAQCAAGPWRPMKELSVKDKHGFVLFKVIRHGETIELVGRKVGKMYVDHYGRELYNTVIAWAEIRRPGA